VAGLFPSPKLHTSFFFFLSRSLPLSLFFAVLRAVLGDLISSFLSVFLSAFFPFLRLWALFFFLFFFFLNFFSIRRRRSFFSSETMHVNWVASFFLSSFLV